MIFTKPEECACNQEVAYLTSPIIKDVGAPLFVLAFARIGVFIEMGAIKIAEGVTVFWKVRWNPVKDDTNALLVHIVNKVLKIFRWAEAACRSIIACDLIAPG